MIVSTVVWALVALAALVLGYLLGASRTRASMSAELASATTASRLLEDRTQALEADAGLATEITAAVGPLAAGVRDLQTHVRDQERRRIAELSRLSEQVTHLSAQNAKLQDSTVNLTSALHSTSDRGAWGEVQLRRIVEYSGMLPHVDFDMQVSTQRDGAVLRPDLVVRLPGDGSIVVDSKAPQAGRLEDADDAAELATALNRHVDALGRKEYWKAFSPTPRFVVCFVPTDGLLSTACAADPSLVDRAMEKNVVLASPSTLLVLLKTVAVNWQQYDLTTEAAKILDLGTELYDRAGTLGVNLGRVGASLDRAVRDYNTYVGSFENRFLVTARKLSTLSMADKHIDQIDDLEVHARRISAEELAYPRLEEGEDDVRGESGRRPHAG